MGKDVVETIKYFGGKKKLFKVHFRNVSARCPTSTRRCSTTATTTCTRS